MSSKPSYTLQYKPFIEGLTRKLHRRFAERYDYEDMLSEAMIASLIAEKKYDPERSEFSGFVKKYVEGAVIRSVTTTSSRKQNLLVKVYKWLDDYAEEHGAIASIEMALTILHIKQRDYDNALGASEHIYRVPLDDVTPIAEENLQVSLELHDAVEKLPMKYRNTVQNYLADRPYNAEIYKTAVKKLKEIMENV